MGLSGSKCGGETSRPGLSFHEVPTSSPRFSIFRHPSPGAGPLSLLAGRRSRLVETPGIPSSRLPGVSPPSSRAYGGQPGPGRIPSRRPAVGDARPGSRSARRSCAPGSPAPAPRRRLCRPPGVMNGRSGSPAPPGRDARPMAARAAWMDEVSAVVSGMECVSVTFRTG